VPELPEVETIRRGLDHCLKNRRISAIEIVDSTVLTGHRAAYGQAPAAQARLRQMIGQKIEHIERLGKFLLFGFASGETLVINLRMTGRLVLGAPQLEVRARFHFEGELRVLNFLDRRRLGEIRIMNRQELGEFRRRMGPDALQTPDLNIFGRRRARIHSALMNQTLLAGVGNIYATEALFRAGIKPQRRLRFLPRRDIERLQTELRRVLQLGVRHRGCTFDSYRDVFNRKGSAQKHLLVYGRSGLPCVSCREDLRFTKISGRGVTWCATCQH
jgi:formamidopyrimidine-DNA glycosylase